MKYRIGMLVAAVFIWMCSCTSDDDRVNEVNGGLTGTSSFVASQQPQWQVNMSDSRERPQWEAPDSLNYENKRSIMLCLQDELVPYSTDDDLMAVFLGDDCRALSARIVNEEIVYFVINVYGYNAEPSESYRLCYYSGGLKQLFELDVLMSNFFNEGKGDANDDITLVLTDGSTKYAVKTKVAVNLPLVENLPINTEDDRFAVFVDGECRGVGHIGETFTVFTNMVGEKGELRYYSQKRGGIFIAGKRLTLRGEPQTVTFEF